MIPHEIVSIGPVLGQSWKEKSHFEEALPVILLEIKTVILQTFVYEICHYAKGRTIL